MAAAKIQATWRMTRDRAVYYAYRKRKWAAGIIAIAWVMHVKLAMVVFVVDQSQAAAIARDKCPVNEIRVQQNFDIEQVS